MEVRTVIRKLAEFGYQRSAKKCKEKFENIYKYHKRTKDGRSSRPNGKSYRFFKQLEALDNNPPTQSLDKINQDSVTAAMPLAVAMPINPTNFSQQTTGTPNRIIRDTSTSTASSSGEESEGTQRKKRKFSDFFEKLMKEVTEKQESLQKKFIEAIERHENERLEREEAWKREEMARIKRQHELLVQERSIAAAKDAAVMAFLQKFSDQSSTVQLPESFLTPMEKSVDKQETSNNKGENYIQTSSSRWPKAEVEALIRIRTTFEQQYQENGPKGSLWEEISASMKKIGYGRSSKRCKEKWENINKYFKRVRESNKKRPEDSKTCPYFSQLEDLYRNKKKKVNNKDDNNNNNSENSGYNFKAEDLLMQMMGHNEQQQQKRTERAEEGGENGNVDQNNQEENEEDEDDEDDDTDNYQIVANDSSSMAIME